uniref:L-gulonate 3-dehydrogenase n=1 Tax=Esox lucius TaxID=8010 RepID=A0AAY5JWY9_ESOLU
MSSSEGKIISVIGSGLIGRSWAMVFMSGGYRVKVYDNKPGQAARAIQDVRKQLEELQEAHMLRGDLSASEQLALLSSHDDLPQALEGAFFVQECVFEEVEAKQGVFQAVESLVGEDVILSSSTSCLLPSNVFARVQNRKRCIISHPVNPPYYVRLVELVPHPEMLPGVMDITFALMTSVGQAPVRLKKEIDGFALNRLQYAIIAESWRLVQVGAVPPAVRQSNYRLIIVGDKPMYCGEVRLACCLVKSKQHRWLSVKTASRPLDGVISVRDIDLVMSEGLGMRYAFIGPMETMHLNAPEGLEDYLKRYREGMRRVLTTFGPVPEFSGEAAERINKEMCEMIPPDHQNLSAKRERRDQLLMGLANLKK